tara:strand:- start:558 stop:854 length:297 start_codon:yes stop_codon:yes gene_type:complete
MVRKKKKVSIYTKEKISLTIPKKIEKKLEYKLRYELPLIAPIKEDQYVADLIVKKNNEAFKIVKLYSNNEVKKINFFSKIVLNLKFLLFGESIISSRK